MSGAAAAWWYLPVVLAFGHFSLGLIFAVLRAPLWVWAAFVAFWLGKEFFGDMASAGFAADVVIDSFVDVALFFVGFLGGGLVLPRFWGAAS